MRKVNFMSGINAKLVLAAMALGSFVLTGCEKEEFKVDVPDIDITIPDAEPGVVYVNLSATSNNGNTLEGVKFTVDGQEINASTAYNAAANFTVIASKDGYNAVAKTVNVPTPVKGSFVVIPVNFVLTAVEAPVATVPGDIDSENPEVTSADQSIKGTYEAGKEYIEKVAIPKGSYLTDAQRNALLAKIDELKGPDTRALSDEEAANLETAKGMLRATVNEMPSKAQTEDVPVTFIPTKTAGEIVFTVTTNWLTQEIKLTATVADKPYSVEGEQTLAGESKISAAGFSITHAHGVEIDHGHGHGGSNAGGGEGGK